MKTETVEWNGNIARPILPMDGAELALLASLMNGAGGRWSCTGGGWVFSENAFAAFHRVPDGCCYNQCPSPFVSHVGAL